jgi:hypothetical protein
MQTWWNYSTTGMFVSFLSTSATQQTLCRASGKSSRRSASIRAVRDSHPVAVLVEGRVFGHPTHETIGQIHSIGTKAFGFFHHAASELEPGYAAITVGSSLKPPTDLSLGADVESFRDFDIGNDFAGQECKQLIGQLAHGAYIESVQSGVFVLCTCAVRPGQQTIPSSMADKLSVAIGTVLSTRLPEDS